MTIKKYKVVGYIDERTYYFKVFEVDSSIYKSEDNVMDYILGEYEDTDDGYDDWEVFDGDILNGFSIESCNEIT